jgi:hypothetical protein
MGYFAQGLLGAADDMGRGKKKKRDMIVVTLVSRWADGCKGRMKAEPSKDQRNHGERTHDRTANLAYDQNERHLCVLCEARYHC